MNDDSHGSSQENQGALPRPPRPGPAGERARIAGPEDSAGVAGLLRQFLQEEGRTPDEDRVGWVAQTATRDPLRGLFVIAESTDLEGVGLAAVSPSLDPARGWVGRFSCLYVRPAQRRRGVAGWLLAETLEFARHHGINHIRFETTPGDEIMRRILATLPLAEHEVRIGEIDLHPHFDDGES